MKRLFSVFLSALFVFLVIGTASASTLESFQPYTQVDLSVFLSLHGQPRSTNLVFRVCREHVLGIMNLLSSLGRIWVSCHHCCIVWGHVFCFCCMVLLLSKPPWFCAQANVLS